MDLTTRIESSKTPFSLRALLHKFPIELKAIYNRKAFQRQIGKLKSIHQWHGDGLLVSICDNLLFDFEAEVIEGVHRTPPPLPDETVKYISKEENKMEIVSPIELEIPSTESGHILKDIEAMAIKQVLDQCEWNRTTTAKRLGISIRTLRNKLDQYRRAGFLNTTTVKTAKIVKEKPRQLPPSPYTIDEPIEETKPIREAKRPEMAKCCPNKLVWMEGLCLNCYKTRKKNLSYKGKHP